MRRALHLSSSVVILLFAILREMGIRAHPRRLRAVMPGTNFCGPGNLSNDPTELGWLVDTDRCCRDHDLCPDYIDSGNASTKYGDLQNDEGVSRFHCDCDMQFYRCLQKNIDDDTSPTSSALVLYIYFALTRVKCFRKEHPIVSCRTHDEYSKDRCIAYHVNGTLPQIYQWFDALAEVIPVT